MKRGGYIRRKSPKRRQQDARDRGTLDVFALEQTRCAICGDGERIYDGLEIHHISGRSSPQRNDRRNLLRVHATCHERCLTNPTDGLDIVARFERVMEWKRMSDPEFYDPQFVRGLKGWR